MSQPAFKVVYAKTEQSGTYWEQIGVAFERDQGGYTLKINSMPMTRFWDGRLFLFPFEDRRKPPKGKDSVPTQQDEYEDLPF